MNIARQESASPDRRYLRYLFHRAHAVDIPYLPVDDLTDRSIREWIAYLRERVAIIDAVDATVTSIEEIGSAPYLLTPSRVRAPDGYRPAWDPIPEAADHDHLLDSYQTEDDHDIVYCTLCGREW